MFAGWKAHSLPKLGTIFLENTIRKKRSSSGEEGKDEDNEEEISC
jgi:hypothetical protein